MIDRTQAWMFAIADLPREAVAGVPLVSGLEARTISRDAASGACTLEVEIQPGFRAADDPDGRLDIFVLDGELAVDGTQLEGGGFATLPRGETVVSVPGARPARAIVIWEPGSGARPAGSAPHVASAWDRSWETNTQPGTPFGLMRRRLREDDSGPPQGPPGGWVRLVHVVPGWCTEGEERHVGCWEENILLRGDVFMADRGAAIRTGDCLANPPGHWHGPMATKGGALFLVHCDRPMGVELRNEGARDADLRGYLARSPWA
jgi:hypothetical protein